MGSACRGRPGTSPPALSKPGPMLETGPTNRNPLQAKISSRLELVVALTGSLVLSQFSIAKHVGTEVAGRPMSGSIP